MAVFFNSGKYSSTNLSERLNNIQGSIKLHKKAHLFM